MRHQDFFSLRRLITDRHELADAANLGHAWLAESNFWDRAGELDVGAGVLAAGDGDTEFFL